MRDANRFKEKVELSLDSRQIFFLLFGGAAASCLVFVMGIMVGKRLESRRIQRKANCQDELARLDRLSGQPDRFTFHKVLVKKGGNPNLPPEVAETADLSEPGSGDGSDPDRFGFRSAPPVAVATPSVSQTRRVQPASSAPRSNRPRRAEPRRGTLSPVVRGPSAGTAGTGAPARASRAATAPPPALPAAAAGRGSVGTRRFTLQVSSFRARSEAEALMRQLESEGLRPYLLSSYIPRRGMWYRIRVGDFQTRTQAKHAKKKFEQKWRMTAYVTRMN